MAVHVNSIPNNIEEEKGDLPENLTDQQTKDIMNLKVIIYYCPGDQKCYVRDDLRIQDLSPIQYFKGLRKVNLSNHKIKEISNPRLNSLKNLTDLDLSFNNIHNKNITTIFPNLEKLNLSGNPFIEIPDKITKLTHLKELILLGKIKKVSIKAGSFNNLKKLTLSGLWKLESFYIESGALNNLEELDSSFVNFPKSTLPTGILSLRNLKHLNLWSAGLTSLPARIDSLTNLEYLNLKWNNLTNLPTNVNSLTKLKILNLEDNQITKISPNTFTNLNELQELNLNDQANNYTWSVQQRKNIQAQIIKNGKIKLNDVHFKGEREP